MNKSKYILTIVCAIGASIGTCKMQEAKAQKVDYTFNRIEQMSPWLTTNNGAGLVFNETPKNFSSVYGYFNNENGKLKNYNQEKSYNNFGLATKSYTKLGKFHFYGLFNYDYTIKKGQTWLGTVYPNTALTPIVEDVPGRVIKEDYYLAAKMAYELSPKFSAGISLNYLDATANKKKDGRNSNTYSDFKVAPSFSFASKYLNFGLALTYGYNSEKVDYEYKGDAAGLHIYYMEGLFMYTSNTITSTGITLDRKYDKNTFGGSIQAELKFGNFSFFNNFSADYSKYNNYEDISLLKRYSTVDALEYAYSGVLKASCEKMEHNFYLGFSSCENLLYNISNIYEEVPGENLWQYYEYGKTLRYEDWVRNYNIALNGIVKRNDYLPCFEYTLGFRFNDIEKTHKIYPAIYEQHFYTRELYASLTKSFTTGESGYIALNVDGAYRTGNGNALTETDPIKNGSITMQKDLLATDYIYNTSDRLNLGASLKYNCYVSREKGASAWIKVRYNYTNISKWEKIALLKATSDLFEGKNRSFIGLSVGYNF